MKSRDDRFHCPFPNFPQPSDTEEMNMKKLKDVMSRAVQVISPDASIMEAAEQMQRGNFGMMPVGENDRMIGAISDRDIAMRAVAVGKDAHTKVRDIMSERIFWAYENDSVDDAAELMGEKQIRRLPVVDTDKRLVGIVALGDLVADGLDAEAAGEALAEISKPQLSTA
jgi:CBS domain-containing protein